MRVLLLESGVARATAFLDERRSDRIRARRDSRHAFQRHDRAGNGERSDRVSSLRRFARASPRSHEYEGRRVAARVLPAHFLDWLCWQKVPAAIILAGGAIGLWALLQPNIGGDAIRLAHPLAIAAFCIVALPWYVVCAVRNPDFLKVFLWQHNFEEIRLRRYFETIASRFSISGPIALAQHCASSLDSVALAGCPARECDSGASIPGKTRPGFFFAPPGRVFRFSSSAFRSPSCPDTFCRRYPRWRFSAQLVPFAL